MPLPRIRSLLPSPITRVIHGIRREREFRQWITSGRPVPPPHSYKIRVVLHHAKRFGLSTLVETGTYLGDMVEACRRSFARVFTIEIDERLFRNARERFRTDTRVTVLQGDSVDVLPRLLEGAPEPCLFWLDGHYSGGITGRGTHETPIIAELGHIGRRGQEDVIIIDDARMFTGAGDYPRLEEVRALVRTLWPGHRFEVVDDIVRVVPSREGG